MERDNSAWQRAQAIFDALLDLPASARASVAAGLDLEPDVRACVDLLLRSASHTGVLDLPFPPRHLDKD